MTQRPYFRDVWCLAPGHGYPGVFPRGLMDRVTKRWNGEKRLMLFAGSFKEKGWDTVDVKAAAGAKYTLDAENLPREWTEKYDFVFADPPYSEKEAEDLYGLPYFNVVKVVNEMARVTKGGGTMAFLHRLVPQYHPQDTIHFKRMKVVGVIGVYTMAGYTNMRALTVWRKQETLEEVH